jgi:hypothetical protein
MRRYSTSTVFGISKPNGSSDNKNDSTKGRRHSSTQPPLSISGGSSGYISSSSKGSPISSRNSPSSGRSDKWRSLARVVLGNVEEHSEHEHSIHEDSGTDVYQIPMKEEVVEFCKETKYTTPIRKFITNYK